MKKYIIVLIGIVAFSCDSTTLEPTLAQSKDINEGLNSSSGLQTFMNGVYNLLTLSSYYGRDVIIYGETRTDNAFANGKTGRFVSIANMNYTNQDTDIRDTWSTMYIVASRTSAVIDSKVEAKDDDDKKLINQLKGQAYALRGLAHYDLVRMFGQQHVTGGNGVSGLGVPYITKYANQENLTPARETVAEVKAKIYKDLDSALAIMDATQNGTVKTHITTHAISAIRSRVAIYFEDWAIAAQASKKVIDESGALIIAQADFVNSWKEDNSDNSIFELAVLENDNNGLSSLSYIYRSTNDTGGYGDIEALTKIQSIFDAGDVRNSASMIGNGAQGKLRNLGKFPTGDPVYNGNINIIRYEEVVLNYAEALFETGDTAGALTQLNSITSQRGANAYTAVTKDDIILERRKELCYEGFRYDDLLRTKQDIVIKEGVSSETIKYGSNNTAFPIPLAEINANSKMVQNKGY